MKTITDRGMKKMIPMFVPGKPGDDHKCGSCSMFVPNQSCTIVKGEISGPNGTCMYQAPGEHVTPDQKHEVRVSKVAAQYAEMPPGVTVNCETCSYFENDYCDLWEGKVTRGDCCLAHDSPLYESEIYRKGGQMTFATRTDREKAAALRTALRPQTEAAAPPDEKAAEKLIVKQVEKRASQLAGKSLKVKKVTTSYKGVDLSFAGGGQFKIRPKQDGAILTKLQGQPKPHYRYLGVGPTLKQSLASMKPEKGKGKKGKATSTILKLAKPASPSIQTKAKKAKNPGPARASVNGLALFNDIGADEDTFDVYARSAKDAVMMLKRKGFGFMLKNVTMHLRKGGSGIFGNYDMKTRTVEIFVNNLGTKRMNIMLTMVHELGHHYYYAEISRAQRKSYRWYFDQAYGGKAPMTAHGGKRVPGNKAQKAYQKGAFPTPYGASVRYEDFAEIFAAFVGKGSSLKPKKYKLTPDIMDRFRTFLAQDKRIKLHDDEDIESLYGRVVLGSE